MGVDYWVYLGPYVLCEFEYRTVTHSIEDRTCPRDHKVTPSMKHCPECGLRITWGIEEGVKTVHPHEAMDEIGRRLRPTGLAYGAFPSEMHHVWTPNVGFGIDRDVDFNPHREQLQQEVDAEMMESELRLFQQTFAEEIIYLKSVYKKCTVEWGLLMYAS